MYETALPPRLVQMFLTACSIVQLRVLRHGLHSSTQTRTKTNVFFNNTTSPCIFTDMIWNRKRLFSAATSNVRGYRQHRPYRLNWTHTLAHTRHFHYNGVLNDGSSHCIVHILNHGAGCVYVLPCIWNNTAYASTRRCCYCCCTCIFALLQLQLHSLVWH